MESDNKPIFFPLWQKTNKHLNLYLIWQACPPTINSHPQGGVGGGAPATLDTVSEIGQFGQFGHLWQTLADRGLS